jgi:uncharacterized membrane protein
MTHKRKGLLIAVLRLAAITLPIWCLTVLAQDSNDGVVFTTIDAPNAVNTRGRAINSEGDIVGWYRDTGNKVHGFLRSAAGSYTVIDVPVSGALLTQALGINDRGDIVGTYTSSDNLRHGFLLSHTGDFSSFDPLNSTDTVARGINDSGEITGLFNFFLHGYLLSRDGTATQIDVPFAGVTDTQAYSVNNRGDVAGSFDDAVGGHGFVLSKKGDYGNPIDFPGTQGSTQLFGNNSRGDLVGCYGDSKGIHAWLRTGDDDFTSFDDPDAQQMYTVAYGISSEGNIVGEYYNPTDNRYHGFLRTKGN